MAHAARSRWHVIGSLVSFQRNVLVFSSTGLLINFGSQVFMPFLPLYLQSLNADIPQIGLVYVGIALAALLASIPGGMFADRLGRKRIIVVGNAVGFGLFLGLLGVSNWAMALLVVFLGTAIATFVQPAYSSTIAESVGVAERASAFGTFYLLAYMGQALGSFVGGLLPNPGRYEINILVLGIAGLVTALTRFVFLKETLPERKENSQSKKSIFVVRLSRNIWLVLAALLTFNLFSGLGQPFYAIFSTEHLGMSQSEFAIMISLGYVVSMLAALWAGKIFRALGVRKLMALSVIAMGLLVLPWVYSPLPIFAILVFAVSGVFSQLFFVGNQTLTANITTPEERSSVIGFITTISGLSSIVAPYVGSQLWVLVDPRSPFLVSVVVALAAAVPIFLVKETPLEPS